MIIPKQDTEQLYPVFDFKIGGVVSEMNGIFASLNSQNSEDTIICIPYKNYEERKHEGDYL